MRRDILNPLFSKRTVSNLSDAIISSTADKFLSRMAAAALDSIPIPLDHAFKCFTIDIISLYTFNKSSDTLSLPDFDPAEMRELLHTIKQAHFTDFFPWVQKVLFLLPARVSRFLNLDMAGLIQVMMRSYALVCDYKARGETEGVLSAMLSEKKGYSVDSDMALAQLALEFLGAGMEETSNALMFATWYITRTTRVEERLVQELKKAIPDVRKNATGDLERLPYLVGAGFRAAWDES